MVEKVDRGGWAVENKSMGKLWIVGLITGGVLLSGCSHIPGQKVESGLTPTPVLIGENTEVRTGGAGDQIVGNYRTYDKTRLEQAKSEGKKIMLFFYANWCPTCKIQEPIVQKVFRDFSSNSEIVGFRVNFADSDTTTDGKLLATEYGITYQHTFVILGTDGQIIKQFNGQWSEEEMREFLPL